ncbi:MMPL family transporter, partial [Acinetobacter baumannii]
ATLSVFSSVGPALAATIFIGFLGSITLLPAFITLAGRKGWVNPRKDITGPMWRRMGVSIVRKPKLNLFGSLVVLLALAGC